MEFILYYEGLLNSNADAKFKHTIREVFHKQLKMLWEQPPLKNIKEDVLVSPGADLTALLKRRKC